MPTKEQRALDRVNNAASALFDVESMLPDGDARRAVYRLRVALREMRDRLVEVACSDAEAQIPRGEGWTARTGAGPVPNDGSSE